LKQPVAAIGDEQIRRIRHAIPQRPPGNATMIDGFFAKVMHADLMAARCQRLGQFDQSSFGTAERAALQAGAVEGNALIGDDDAAHDLPDGPGKRRRGPYRGESGRARRGRYKCVNAPGTTRISPTKRRTRDAV